MIKDLMTSETKPKANIHTWSFVSPETFELTLRRLVEPSAEAKMQAALDTVLQQIEEAERSPLAEQRAAFHKAEELRRKRERLERRIAKLQELKRKAAGPLIGGLLFGLLVWLLILAGVGGAGYSIQQALAKDMENIKENQETGLTIEELDANVSVGQLMGMPDNGDSPPGEYEQNANGDYPAPAFLLETTQWTPQFDGCDLVLESTNFTGEVPGCVAAARWDMAIQGQPEITQRCIVLQLGPEDATDLEFTNEEQVEFSRELRVITDQPAFLKPRFFSAGAEDSWNSTTLVWCQVLGTEDELLARKLTHIAGQVTLRTNSQAYLAGGLFTWLESDGSYAPRSQWEGHGPSELTSSPTPTPVETETTP